MFTPLGHPRRILAPAALTMAIGLTVSAGAARAELVIQPSPHSVTDTTDAFVAAVEAAGASVIARVDHGAAAAGADMNLGPAELVIFGNPRIGTPVMQEDIRAGLVLPLRVLVYEDDAGDTQILFEAPYDMLSGYDVDVDAEAVARIASALEALTSKAVE